MLYIIIINTIYLKDKQMDAPKHKSIIAIFGTEKERQAMWQLRKAAEKDSSLSWSDFILQHFGIRDAKGGK
jgi:hypothetical protein